MMTYVYQETYLNNIQTALGDAFDYAINTCSIAGPDFTYIFSASATAKRIENRELSVLVGMSGIEIARQVLLETTGNEPEQPPEERFNRTAEYWIGWAVAYYQWFSDRKFTHIFQALPFEDLQALYPTLHEADVSKFAEVADTRVREFFQETNLKRIRNLCGYTQAELAAQTGVGLRSIQMYEQRKKDINKASAEAIYRLSKALMCDMEDLIKK